MAKIYIGNLDYSIQEDELSKIFSSFGAIKSIRIPKEEGSHDSKGYAFIDFEQKDSAEEAINKLNGTKVGGRVLTISNAHPEGVTL